MVDKLVIVTGLSGAGKSTAMSILEDLSYQCVDHLPYEVLSAFVQLLKKDRYTNVALSTTLDEVSEIDEELNNLGIDHHILLLNANDNEILTRYKLTKHLHPLITTGKASTIEQAISIERKAYDNLPQFKKVIYINTDKLNQQQLKRELEAIFGNEDLSHLSITFQAFGYKYGTPKDADLIFDARVLPNPYWVPELRNYTGDDKEVYEYVINSEEAKPYLENLVKYLDYVFDIYSKEGRVHLIIGIGCTGGQHRSLSVVNYLIKHYSEKYICYKSSYYKENDNE